jgi:hypothetical protein
MELLICSFVVLILFFVRDVFLFGSTHDHLSPKVGLYCGLTLFYFLVALRIWHSLAPEEAMNLVRSPRVWVLTLLMHAALWFVAAWFKRRPQSDNKMWIMAVAPAPMLILAVVAFSQRLTMLFSDANGLVVGSLVSSVWVASVLIAVVIFRRANGERENVEFAATLAEIASWTGIGILPFTGLLEAAEVFLKYD